MIFGFIIGFIYVLLDIVYWTKWTVTIILLWIQKKTTHRRFDLYDFEADYEPEKVGVVIPTEEKILESPFDEEHLQKAADEVFFYGANSKSQSMVVRISRSCNDESEAWIYLKLADGHWYELEETKGYQRNFTDKCTSFTCGGLQMYYLSPMRKWRISYCGMLKKRKSASDVEGKSVFVKFTFIWTASSDVYDASYDLDIQGAAAAVARAKWNSYLPPIDRIPKILDLYCQSGVLDGVVSIENEPDMEMYLFGERMRLTGESSYLAGGKYKHLVGVVPESGLVVHLARVSYPNTFEPFLFGFIVHPSSNVYIGKTALRMTRMDDVERRLIVKFTAGKDYLLRGHYVGEGLHFTSEHGWHGHLEMLGINFEIDDCKGTGFILMGENAAKPRDVNQKKIQNIPPSISTAKPLTVYFTDEASHSSDLTGGKGSSLGKLTKLSKIMKSEFIVPKGIVVTTAAYDEFVTPEILQKIENLKDIVYGNIKGNIQEACKIVQIAIERAYLPDKITKEIETKLKTLFGENINTFKVAVRSSATGEDTDQMSAAGQMDTFLGVQGLKEIFTAVKKCWASQFGPIATEYKRRNGQILNSGMAVVIQEMVKCEAAGVLFTCDPVTNNPSVTVLTGNYGLGESVVSGSEEPDTIVLEKLPNDEMLIKSKLVGMKQHRIVLMDTKPSEDEEGTVLEEVPEDQRNSCCISDEMALKLGKLSRKIENYYKSPRDIEWGLKNNVIYMLQSRPITTGDTVSDYEIIHEFDAALKCEEEYYTKHNVGEVMPGATSPLGIDIVVKYFAMTFQKEKMKKMQGNNFLQSKYYQAGILSFYNHMHLGVADLIARIDDIDSKEAQSMMMGMFGRILDDPELKVLIKRKDYKKMKSSLSFKFNFLWGSAVTFKSIQRGLCTLLSSFGIQTKNMFFCGSTIEKVKDEVFNCKVKAENGKTAKEIFNLIVGACSDFTEMLQQDESKQQQTSLSEMNDLNDSPLAHEELQNNKYTFHNHMTCTEMSSFWNMLLFNVLQEAKKGVDNEVYADFAKLLASSSNVESADVPASMQDLAEAIVKEIKGEKFRAMPVEDALKWLETATCLAGYKYRQFIERHGHRCLKEFDVHSISWSRDPKSLVKLLQTMTISCEHVKEKKESDGLPNLSIPLNMKSRLLLKLILPNCRRGVREREACKSNMIKAIDNNRRGFHRLSQAMVAEGYLPDTDLMYFLTVDEIKDLLETRNPRLIARASHRRKVYPKLDALSFPDISKGRPVPLNEEQEEVEYVADLTMKGIPVSQGIVKGYARVARTLEEAANLKQGEILITNSTDIGWSPYFPIIGGVVTEIGGLISHGAVVSREYGLPCVVGLHGATRQFFTGDYVLLDGNKGILQRLSPPES